MGVLCFLRHAPVSVAGLCYGQTDVATAMPHEGAAQAMWEQLPESLEFEAVWTSPLPRCLEPARILASKLDVSLRVDSRLLELSFGAWEGMSWAQLEREDGSRFRSWCDDWEHVRPPEGESLPELLDRVRAALDSLRSMRQPQLIITHAGVIRAATVLLGESTAREAWANEVPHLRAVTFRSPEQGMR